MGNKRDLKIYGLSTNRYRELKYFCLQYYEWKEQLRQLGCGISAYEVTGMPKSNTVAKPTESVALKRAELEKNISLIESAAKQASPIMYKEILKNVSQDIPYRYLNVPCCLKSFYKIRKEFFIILDKKKENN